MVNDSMLNRRAVRKTWSFAYDDSVNIHLPNLRDVGGKPAEGGSVQTGRLFRSALPLASDLVPANISWPPVTVIDLRSDPERVLEPQHPLAGAGVSVHTIPLLTELRPGDVPPTTLIDLYQYVLKTTADRLVNVVDTVAASTGATLVHCAVGKDRTGISIAMVLNLLGVPREEIVQDYLETEKNTEAIIARWHLMNGDTQPPLRTDFMQTPVEAIEGVLDVWEGHVDGAVGWFRQAGGSDNTVDRLRDSMVKK